MGAAARPVGPRRGTPSPVAAPRRPPRSCLAASRRCWSSSAELSGRPVDVAIGISGMAESGVLVAAGGRGRARCRPGSTRGARTCSGAAGGAAREFPRPPGCRSARWPRSPSCWTSGPAGSTCAGSPGSTCPSTSRTCSVVTGTPRCRSRPDGPARPGHRPAVGAGTGRARRGLLDAAAAPCRRLSRGAAPVGCRLRWPRPYSPWRATTTWSRRSPPAWSIPISSTTPSGRPRRSCGSRRSRYRRAARRPGGRRRQRGPPPAPRAVHHAGGPRTGLVAPPGAQPRRHQRRGRPGRPRRAVLALAGAHRPARPGRNGALNTESSMTVRVDTGDVSPAAFFAAALGHATDMLADVVAPHRRRGRPRRPRRSSRAAGPGWPRCAGPGRRSCPASHLRPRRGHRLRCRADRAFAAEPGGPRPRRRPVEGSADPSHASTQTLTGGSA